MKTYNYSLKPILMASLFFSFAMLAATLSDYIIYSDNFMEIKDIKLVKRLDDSSFRDVASSRRLAERPKVLFMPINKSNRELINRNWLIYNYIDAEDQNHPASEVTTLQLIGTSLVQVGNNLSEIYYISFMSDSSSRIALFRAVEGGYEILEAKVINIHEQTETLAIDDTTIESSSGDTTNNHSAQGVNFSKNEGEFVLEHIIYTNKSGQVHKNLDIDGGMAISNGQIENLIVSAQKADQELELEILVANINDGGQFMAEVSNNDVPVSGIISNAGKSWVIRISTGQMAGFTLKFSREQDLPEHSRDNLETTSKEDNTVQNEQTAVESADEMIFRAEEMLDEAALNEDEALKNRALLLLQKGERQVEQEEIAAEEKAEAAEEQSEAIIERAGFGFANNGNR
ncbi:MAG: hypothetical protein HN353_12800 [Bdellovibrionales bacterium]|jgi:hypothetical protein|nr:hypothetical protein [Bdellovibrionales bacterium]MBT3525329.1 hypothetical protein [Bdellovibrionales bacterium]MBT7669818.1 hypothetical protein [Bdellovibrionales bacterium]MBT7765551.1 hypothetical protein [Bdellovibrionales bacterium]